MTAGEVGDVLEPVLPAAAEAVDEDDRHPALVLRRPRLDIVDAGRLAARTAVGGGVDVGRSQVLAPIDPKPFRVRVAIRVGSVGGRRIGNLGARWGEEPGPIEEVGEETRLLAPLWRRGSALALAGRGGARAHA